ncbi:serine protein kinase [Xylariaceae sp. FL0255]|nr:serine protein kinase [Xylariaceae sp. FL0255]
MESPPPTPPSRAQSDDEHRFKMINTPCEWIEDYRPGGYHPVHLGDLFNYDHYQVIRKLGEGSYSTVWLARDTKNNNYVALKILVSDSSESLDELRMLEHIFHVAPGKASLHITQLLNQFEHSGPNGTHKCFVFEPMGPSVNSMVEELPQFKPRLYGMKLRYPPQMARAILKQSLQALEFLHENGIAHGDFQPGNIRLISLDWLNFKHMVLFALDDIGSVSEDLLRQGEVVRDGAITGSLSPPVERIDGKEDRWAPRYLCVGKPLADFTNYMGNLKIKLSDMGGAYFFKEPSSKPIIPAGLRAPELILTGNVNETFDVWSFGCLLFELVTGQPLCCVPWDPTENGQDDDHLLQLTYALGPLPDELYKHWKTSSLYFTTQRELYNCNIGGIPEGEEPYMIEQVSMEEMFDRAKPEIEEAEADEVKSLIRRILQYDPAQRPSAAEILQDPWFCKT